MKLKTDQTKLKRELGLIRGVTDTRVTIPILGNVVLETIGEAAVRITGSNLDCTLRCEVEAEVIEPGAICIGARTLADIMNQVSGEVEIAIDSNDWLRLRSGRTEYRLPAITAAEFPEIPQIKSVPATVSAECLGQFIRRTSFAIIDSVSHYALSAAKFEVADGKVRMVGTDAHRLAYIEREFEGTIDGENTIDMLIPRQAVIELGKMLQSSPDDKVAFGEDLHHLFFEHDNRLLIVRKLTGQYPDYRRILEIRSDKVASFDLREACAAVGRVGVVADTKTLTMRFAIRPGEIEISAQSSDAGEGRDVIEADYEGEEVVIGFNWRYLFQFLSVLSSEAGGVEVKESAAVAAAQSGKSSGSDAGAAARSVRLSFEFSSANEPVQMRVDGEQGFDYRFILMPVRIR